MRNKNVVLHIPGLGFLVTDPRMGEGFHCLLKHAPKNADILPADSILSRHWKAAFEAKRVFYHDVKPS